VACPARHAMTVAGKGLTFLWAFLLVISSGQGLRQEKVRPKAGKQIQVAAISAGILEM